MQKQTIASNRKYRQSNLISEHDQESTSQDLKIFTIQHQILINSDRSQSRDDSVNEKYFDQNGRPEVDPMKEHKQTSITNSIEPKKISRKMNKFQLLGLENPFCRMKIKESEIPLDAIYNREINAMKSNERIYDIDARPLAFSIWKNFDGVKGHNICRLHVDQQDMIMEHEY